jgi:hypothetical protein
VSISSVGLRRTELRVFLTKSERRSKWSDVSEIFLEMNVRRFDRILEDLQKNRFKEEV